MQLTIVPVYASILALLFVALSLRVIFVRRTMRTGIGDGGNAALLRRIRVHANFAEYVPLALLLLAFVEWQTKNSLLVNALCIALTAGRVAHAAGVSQAPEPLILRQIGMVLTFLTLVTAAIILIAGRFA